MKLIDYLKSAANIESRVARAVVLLWHTPMYLLAGLTSALGVVKTVAKGPVAELTKVELLAKSGTANLIKNVETGGKTVVSDAELAANYAITEAKAVEQAFVAKAPVAQATPAAVVTAKVDPGLAHAAAQAPAAIVDDQDG